MLRSDTCPWRKRWVPMSHRPPQLLRVGSRPCGQNGPVTLPCFTAHGTQRSKIQCLFSIACCMWSLSTRLKIFVEGVGEKVCEGSKNTTRSLRWNEMPRLSLAVVNDCKMELAWRTSTCMLLDLLVLCRVRLKRESHLMHRNPKKILLSSS